MSLSIELPDEFTRAREVLEAIEARTDDKTAVLVHDCAMLFVAYLDFCRVHNVPKENVAKFAALVSTVMGKHIEVDKFDLVSAARALSKDIATTKVV